MSSQTSNVRMKLKWDENGQKREAEGSFLMGFFFRYELEHLIRLSNLKLEAVYGEYGENRVGKDSIDFVLVCSRRK